MCNDCRYVYPSLDEEGQRHECIQTGVFVPSGRKSKQRQKYRQKKTNLRDLAKSKRARPTSDTTPSKAPNKRPALSGTQLQCNMEQLGTSSNNNGEMGEEELQQIIDAIPSRLQSPQGAESTDNAPMDEEMDAVLEDGEVDVFA